MRREATEASELISSKGWRDCNCEIRYRDGRGSLHIFFCTLFNLCGFERSKPSGTDWLGIRDQYKVQADFVTFVPPKI